MKTKTIYYISAYKGKDNRSQYLLPNELHLIKTMLNDGLVINGVEKLKINESEYKSIFG
jgi:hypothetical protein